MARNQRERAIRITKLRGIGARSSDVIVGGPRAGTWYGENRNKWLSFERSGAVLYLNRELGLQVVITGEMVAEGVIGTCYNSMTWISQAEYCAKHCEVEAWDEESRNVA